MQVTAAPTVRTATTTLTVTNVAPVATVTNIPTGVLAGSNASVTFGASDPAADTAAGFTYLIDWGDDTPQSVTAGASTALGHTYATAGTFTISVTATDKDGATSSATSAITVNPAVTADAGGPYTIAEGQTLTLDATGSVAGPTATHAWDLDADGQFDDATGASPTIPAADLAALGLADGPAAPLPSHCDGAGGGYKTAGPVAPGRAARTGQGPRLPPHHRRQGQPLRLLPSGGCSP